MWKVLKVVNFLLALAQCVNAALAPETPPNGNRDPDPFHDKKGTEDSGLDKGYIIIIVIAACMVIFGGLFFAVFWICWRRKKKALEREQEEAFRARQIISQQRTLDRVTSLDTRSSVVSDIRVQKRQAADYWSGKPIAKDPAVEVKEDMKLAEVKEECSHCGHHASSKNQQSPDGNVAKQIGVST